MTEKDAIREKWQEGIVENPTVTTLRRLSIIDYLLNMVDKNGVVCQDKREISRECRISVGEVDKVLTRLRANNFIYKKNGLIFITELASRRKRNE